MATVATTVALSVPTVTPGSVIVTGSGVVLVELLVSMSAFVMIFTMLARIVEALVVRAVMRPSFLPMSLPVLAVVPPMPTVVVVGPGRSCGPGQHRESGRRNE